MLPVLGEYRLSQAYGQWSAETQLNRAPLSCGETVFTSSRSTTGQQANPWAMIDDGRTGEDHGAVWSCAPAWRGSGKLTAQRLPFGRGTLAAGFGHDPVTWELRAGAGLPRAGDGAPGRPTALISTRRRLPLDFGLRVAMAGVLGVGGDLNRWDEGEPARAAERVAAYKRVRLLVQRSEQYRLRPVGDGELSAAQYLAPDGRETAVAARYREALTGAVPLSQGLPLHLDADDYASTLVHLVREQG
ncbi:glycoside hydrolase family 36 N-terminal domain-containing protein [Streptomyces griseorubiginosus]|uniref:glycoside hydrolase family 36 N-terminal domain-containing protein n=1 Tax=Streptomyces griseorubiginosus TaxID=67304 RepID=UPI003625E8E7